MDTPELDLAKRALAAAMSERAISNPSSAEQVTSPSHEANKPGALGTTPQPARFSTDALLLKAIPKRDLPRLPIGLTCKQTLAYMELMVDFSREQFYITKQDVPEATPHSVMYGLTMQTLQLIFDTYSMDRWVMREEVTDPSLTAKLNKIKQALEFYADNWTSTEQRKRRKDLTFRDDNIAVQVSLLNPMLLTAEEMQRVGSRARVDSYGFKTKNLVYSRRNRATLARDVTPGKLSGRSGSPMMEPIFQDTKAFYWATYACHFRKHGLNPLYMYHALAWGRALYHDVLKVHGYDKCPLYGVDRDDYMNNGATYLMTEDKSSLDIRYLQLAEMDWRNILAGMGTLRQEGTLRSQTIALPTYSVISPEDPKPEDFEVANRHTVKYQYTPAHRVPGWVGFAPSFIAVGRHYLGWHILKEKVSLGIMPESEIEPLGVGVKYTTNINGHPVPIDSEAHRDAVSPAEKVKLIQRLNDEYTVIDYTALARRKEIVEAYRSAK